MEARMLYYVIRIRMDNEPIALVRINAKENGDMVILKPVRHPRFGAMAPIQRVGRHVYNLMIGDNEEVESALSSPLGYQLDEVTQAEWESFDAFELFPVLKLGMVR